MALRILIFLTCIIVTAPVNEAAERSLADTVKKIFATPTPTPHKKKSSHHPAKKSPTPSPTAKPTGSPTPTAKKSATPAKEESPSVSRKKTRVSPTPSPTASPRREKRTSLTPEPFESPSPSPTSAELPTPTPQAPTPSPSAKHGAPNASLSPEQIKGFENYPANVQKLLVSALELTTRNLDYKYGSADPMSGGMDCSGFVYFVLKQNGVEDVPRDSSQQYVWLRRARRFEAVLSQKDDSFELEDLKPGDLLFWTGTYSIERDPPITHAMIYLGREKKTGNRVMVGASDGRVYQGESRFGVSVFDFKIQRRETNGEGKLRPTFIGYGHIPGLQD
jgi:cell wall-associated NlpC family hydrolase